MESTLHRQLKERHGPASGGRLEVVVDGYRVDAVEADGRLVEVQAGRLGALKAKLPILLAGHRVLVVKPIVLRRRIIRRATAGGPDLSSRRSPRRGDLLEVFDELVGLARVFPHERLAIAVVGVAIAEVRVGRGRAGRVVDRALEEVVSSTTLREAGDLWGLLPPGLDGPLTTLDYARKLGRPIAFAERLAYCLRLAGAVETIGTVRRRRLYERAAAGTS